MSITRTFQVLDIQLERCPTNRAIGYLRQGVWHYYSSIECQEQVLLYAGALQRMGLQKGDFIIMVPKMVLPEWLFLDLAAQSLGIVVVAAHATSSQQQFHIILEETKAAHIFILDLAAKDQLVGEDRFKERQFIYIREAGHPNHLKHYLKNSTPIALATLKSWQDSIAETDLATIAYTSGSTGRPKGVMLSHQNLVYNINVLISIFPLKSGGPILAFLPYSHIFERNTIFIYLANGMQIHMIGDRSHFQESLRVVRPVFFITVPRILEKIYDQVIAYQTNQKWFNRQWLKWAIQVGSSEKVHLWAKVQKLLVHYFIFEKLRRQFGGRLEAIIVGAAHLQPKLSYFYSAAGIKIRQGYGMTETAPIISINRFQPGLFDYQTVGLPMAGMDVKIDAPNEDGEGEILVKGPNVMMGYYQQPDLTKQAFNDEGWLKTGDVGKWIKGRFLQITDRKKAIFKTSAGKYIAPLVLENHFKESDFIDQIMVIGFNRPYLVALLVPNFELLENWCVQEGIHWTSPKYMVLNIKVKEKLDAEVTSLNEPLPNHQRIKNVHILADEWTVESQQLSHTQKIMRDKIQADYQKEIDRLYSK